MWSNEEMEALYGTIFCRKSIRKLKQEPLGQAFLEELMEKAGELTGPLPEGKAAFRILEQRQLKGIVSAKAPHYLALYGEKDDRSIIHGAFQLQQMDLWLSSKGIGTCWLGMPRPTDEAQTEKGLPFLVVLAFGAPEEEAHRKQTTEFKRKPLSEITNRVELESLLEPVRLAPSATNRQPWYLDGDDSVVRLHKKSANPLTGKMLGHMPLLDMGIALCHLWLSACHHNRFDGFQREESPVSPSGYQYVWSVGLSS